MVKCSLAGLDSGLPYGASIWHWRGCGYLSTSTFHPACVSFHAAESEAILA